MSLKSCYVAKLGNGCTFLGALKSIERVAKNIKTCVTKKELSKSIEGEQMFACACGRQRVLQV
jgi:hypothetical protein